MLAAKTTSHARGVAQVVVTNNSYDHEPSVLTADDVIVTDGYNPLPVTALVPLRGDRADLEIYVLVDNSSNSDLGERFMELREFLDSQLPTTSIGVAYIRDGRLEVAQRPTHDRARAMQALARPSGNIPSNPFRALAELIEGWHPDSSRHVVLMISSGIDPGASGLTNESVEIALQSAQRAGVMVYSIYHPAADYPTIGFMATYSGQAQLAHLSTETGGAAYFQSPGPLPSFVPYLADIGEHLANQYLLKFGTNSETRGGLQDVSVTSKIRDVHVTAPWRVSVPAPPDLTSDPLANGGSGSRGKRVGKHFENGTGTVRTPSGGSAGATEVCLNSMKDSVHRNQWGDDRSIQKAQSVSFVESWPYSFCMCSRYWPGVKSSRATSVKRPSEMSSEPPSGRVAFQFATNASVVRHNYETI
jgi:hypothetical protein